VLGISQRVCSYPRETLKSRMTMKKIIITTLAFSLTAPFAFSADNDPIRTAPEERSRMPSSVSNNESSDLFQSSERDRDRNLTASESDAETWAQRRERELEQTGDRAERELDKASDKAQREVAKARDSSKQAWQDAQQQLASLGADSIRVISREEAERHESIDDILGVNVVDRGDRRIGSISDIALADDQISDVFVRVGGILGFGGQMVRVPFEALDKVEQNDEAKVFQVDVESGEFTRAIDKDQGVELREGTRAEVASSDSIQQQRTADDLQGVTIFDQQGERLGTLARIAYDDEDRLRAYIEVDEMEGMSEHYVQVPLASIQEQQQNGERTYQLGISRNEFTQAVQQALPQPNRAQS